jgi:hypothetical protein
MSLDGSIMLAAWAGTLFFPSLIAFLVLIGYQPTSRAISSCANGGMVQAGKETDIQSIDVQFIIYSFCSGVLQFHRDIFAPCGRSFVCKQQHHGLIVIFRMIRIESA